MTTGLLAQVEPVLAAAAEDADALPAAATSVLPLIAACVLFAVGVWLSLPRGGGDGARYVGRVLTVIALGIFGWQLPLVAGWVDRSLFVSLAVVTVLSCLFAVTSRNAVYSAIWFGLALLGTAGLFLLLGAQFLSVATVTVYAGAILVTFLFVIMLAQPRGHAYYDRVSWEAFLSAAAGAVLVGLLTGGIGQSVAPVRGAAAAAIPVAGAADPLAAPEGVLAEDHVASLGRELLGRHLISMQTAGALMLAALVGAVAIVAHGRQSGPAAVELASGRMIRSSGEPEVTLPPRDQRGAPSGAPGGIHA